MRKCSYRNAAEMSRISKAQEMGSSVRGKTDFGNYGAGELAITINVRYRAESIAVTNRSHNQYRFYLTFIVIFVICEICGIIGKIEYHKKSIFILPSSIPACPDQALIFLFSGSYNGIATTSAGSFLPRTSTSRLVPGAASPGLM